MERRSRPLLEESTSVSIDARRLGMSLKLRAIIAFSVVSTALVAACLLPRYHCGVVLHGSLCECPDCVHFSSLMYLKITWKRKMHLDRVLSATLLVFSILGHDRKYI